MKTIEVDLPKGGDNVGTLAILKVVLSTRCPKMGTYENQQRLYKISQHLLDHGQDSRVTFSDQDYEWIMSHLKEADYSGMVAGRMIAAFDNPVNEAFVMNPKEELEWKRLQENQQISA